MINFIIGFVVGGSFGLIIYSMLAINSEQKLKMKFINIDTDTIEQQKKCCDEMSEFISGVMKDNPDNIIEEFYDVIQSMLGVIKILGLQGRLVTGLKKHNKKLKGRGWKFENIE